MHAFIRNHILHVLRILQVVGQYSKGDTFGHTAHIYIMRRGDILRPGQRYKFSIPFRAIWLPFLWPLCATSTHLWWNKQHLRTGPLAVGQATGWPSTAVAASAVVLKIIGILCQRRCPNLSQYKKQPIIADHFACCLRVTPGFHMRCAGLRTAQVALNTLRHCNLLEINWSGRVCFI